MTPVNAWIGLGSNLNHPRQQLQNALQAMADTTGIRLMRRSPWYVSTAIGPGEQPDYLNGVVEILTELTPERLLQSLQRIETAQGRERRVRWGPRTLDLDVLLYDTHWQDTPELSIPHPRLHERAFVLAPLADLQPDLALPTRNGEKSATIARLLSQCPPGGLRRLDGENEVVPL